MNRSTMGVSADGLVLQLARKNGTTKSTSIRSTGIGPEGSFPNSILLPRFPGEPYRFDIGVEPHPRGSGHSWPSEAIAHPDYGVGRLPVGMVLGHIESGDRIRWGNEEKRSYSATEALAGSMAQLLDTHVFNGELIFVIPNHWGETLQQEVIDSFQMCHLRARLLWRPVAASLEWLDVYQSELVELRGPAHSTVGKILSIHIGYDQLEITELELVAWETSATSKCIVPGRRRPKPERRIPGFGYRRAFQQIAEQLDRHGTSTIARHERFAKIWNRAWCTNSLHELSGQPLLNSSPSQSSVAELESELFHVKQIDLQNASEELRKIGRTLQKSYTGIVVSGDHAKQKFNETRKVWSWVLDSLETTSKKTLVEGVDSPAGLLSRGACQFAVQLRDNRPTYLDTLPQMEMVISEKGKPTWINLLESDQKWVDGGKLWERPERIEGLSVAANSVDLKLAVAHEEFEYVREVVTDLPNPPETAVKVSLSVQMLPAQGKARIEIHPEHTDLFAGERIFLDWRKMTDFVSEQGLTVDKQGYINSLPRIFPELLPRIASAHKWRNASYVLSQLQMAMKNGDSPLSVTKSLVRARDLLREKDQTLYPQDATAFNSDGKCAHAYDLNSFMDLAWGYFNAKRPGGFIRAIAYTHTDHPKFIQFVHEQLKSHFVHPDYVLAAGKCFRDAKHISTFVAAMFREHETNKLTNTWWTAVSEMLRFREDATRLLSSEDCAYLMQLAGEVFENERKRGSGRLLFRTACLVVVYILRRRAFDDSFLEPDSELAEWIKDEFRTARRDAKSGRLRLMGGSVDLSSQLQLIIDYVDRQGKGQLLIGG